MDGLGHADAAAPSSSARLLELAEAANSGLTAKLVGLGRRLGAMHISLVAL